MLALIEHLRFRRVQVFGLAAIKAATTKANDAPLAIVNRHHQPVAKTVVKTIAPLAGDHQSSGL